MAWAEAGGERPLVHALLAGALPLGQFLALVQRHRHAHLRLDEQVVLGEEAGEQHAMPVFVGALLDEAFDGLGAGLGITEITS